MNPILIAEKITDIDERFILESDPVVGVALSRRPRDSALSRFLSSGVAAAVISGVVALGVLSGIVMVGRMGSHTPLPSMTERPTETEVETEPKTEAPSEWLMESDVDQLVETEPKTEAPSEIPVLKAWSGEFSEEELRLAINAYQSNYAIVVLEKGNAPSISFETDFEASSCSITRLSYVDDTDIEIELQSYIDLFLKTTCEGRTVTIPIDWWYARNDSWVNDYFVWSYLIRVKDIDGNSHYYYFRVDYSAYAE